MGERLGKYDLIERIGVGGMAEVFRARLRGAEGFERTFAVKRVLPHIAEDRDFVTMFIDEAKIAVELSHPNIAQVLDLGLADGSYYIAMEYVHGRDLRALWDREREYRWPASIPLALHIATRVCEALHHAHFAVGRNGVDLNIVHRDVSPQNVLIGFDGEVKVIDFGLAKAAGRSTRTQAGIVKGKLAYMSPEQSRGRPLDRRSDVFAVGIVTFEMLTGTRLFLGDGDVDTLQRVMGAQVPSMRAINPRIPRELEYIVRKSLALDPADRFDTAIDLHDALQEFVYASGAFFESMHVAEYMRTAFPEAAEPQVEASTLHRAESGPQRRAAGRPEQVQTVEMREESTRAARPGAASDPYRRALPDFDDDDSTTTGDYRPGRR